MNIHEITEETTFRDVLKSLENVIKKNIKPNIQKELKNSIVEQFHNTGITFNTSRGGAHYGYWWTPCRGTDIKVAVKIKKTGKIIKVTKLRSSYEMEFVSLDLNYDNNPKDLLDKKIIDYIKKKEGYKYYNYFLVERLFYKLHFTNNMSLEEFEQLHRIMPLLEKGLTLTEQVNEYYKYASWCLNPVIKTAKEFATKYPTVEDFKKSPYML